MVDSVQGLLILILTMPGFLGYLCFNRLSDGCVDDAFEKVGIVVGLNVGAILVGSFFGFALPANLLDATHNLTASGVFEFVGRSLAMLTGLAVGLGALFAALGNWRWLSALLVRLRVTRRSSAHSVLADVIRTHPDSFFRVYFKNGNYVVGHPRCYSLDGEETMLFMDRAAVSGRTGTGKTTQRPVTGAGIVLLNFEDVSYVELV